MTDQSRPSLAYDVVVATRHRPDVLSLSLPLFVNQSRGPERVIVVDSSDDPEPVRQVIAALPENCRDRIDYHHTDPGLPYQRNYGLKQTTGDVVMFPDDDSLWYPDSAAEVMRVYEADAAKVIGGVGMAEVRTPPPAVRDAVESDRRPLKDRLLYRLGPIRARVQGWISPPPFRLLGRSLSAARMPSGWSPPTDSRLVPHINGFRMTFRGEAIRQVGFDEILIGYALYEDTNVCFDVMKSHVLVDAIKARTYHHRAAGSRANPQATGAMLVLNMAYVVCRHSDPGDPARAALPKYMRVRAKQYQVRARDEFGRRRMDAFRRAQRWLNRLIEAPRERVVEVYHEAIAHATAEPARES